MKLKAISAAIAMAVGAGNAAAEVILPNAAGGSELVFFFGGGAQSGATTGYSQDLGVQLGNFNASVSQAWYLAPSFNIFLDPARYSSDDLACNGERNGTICDGGQVNVTDPSNPNFGFGVVQWGILAGDSTPGSAKVLTTWGINQDAESALGGGDPLNTPPGSSDAAITGTANGIQDRWAAGVEPVSQATNLNERPGHSQSGIANGADLYRYEFGFTNPNGDLSDPGNPLTPQGQIDAQSRLRNFMGFQMFNGEEWTGELNFNTTVEVGDGETAMYLFTEGSGPEALPGRWSLNFADYDSPTLVYSINGELPDNPNPAPVPVPAAVWLLGSAMFGMVGIARRRRV